MKIFWIIVAILFFSQQQSSAPARRPVVSSPALTPDEVAFNRSLGAMPSSGPYIPIHMNGSPAMLLVEAPSV